MDKKVKPKETSPKRVRKKLFNCTRKKCRKKTGVKNLFLNHAQYLYIAVHNYSNDFKN